MEEQRRRVQEIFAEVDVAGDPTTSVPAPSIAGRAKDLWTLRSAELILLCNTRPFIVWGSPAISFPGGFSKTGLPIGLPIARLDWREGMALRLTHAFEHATIWHRQSPVLV